MISTKSEDETRSCDYRTHVAEKNAQQIIAWAIHTFGTKRIALASSFSIEDQVLKHMLVGVEPRARIFTLDTGRIFQPTYDVMQQTAERYNITYEVLAPDTRELEDMVATCGPNLFYQSVELRRYCCEIRKLNPLRRALSTVDAWICGLRRDQSVTRTAVGPVEWDEQFSIYKINPLYAWTETAVWDYIKAHDVPYNRLYDEGFKSIGCAPCTRAIQDGEDVRAGRWWWEEPQHKECGLHVKRND